MKQERIRITTDYHKSGDVSHLPHKELEVNFGTEEEAIDSIEKLLRNRPRTFKQLIQETGESQSSVTKAVAHMVNKGRAIVDNFIEHKDGSIEAQLKLNF